MNMAEKVKFMCADGVVVEADKKVMRFASKVVGDMTDVVDTNIGTIPLQNISALDLERVIDICGDYYLLFEAYEFESRHDESYNSLICNLLIEQFSIDRVFSSNNNTTADICEEILRSQNAGMIHIGSAVTSEPEAYKAKIILEGFKFDVGVSVTHFTNKSCASFNWEAIKSMHKVAKYLDIKFLLVLTEALIKEAPSRKFMEVVSPWVDYKDLEAYRSLHVEACRNLEVTVA